MEYLIAFFIKLVGFFSFGLFLGVLIKRSAFAVATMIVLFFVEFISYAIVSGYNRGTDVADNIYQFLPFKSLWNLIDEPGSRLSAVQAVAHGRRRAEVLPSGAVLPRRSWSQRPSARIHAAGP